MGNRNLDFIGKTDTGLVRGHNEDAFVVLADEGATLLADGMGGQSAGEVASSLAIRSARQTLSRGLRWERFKSLLWRDPQRIVRLVETSITRANQEILDHAENNVVCKGMGTTLVVAVFLNDHLVVGHMGDSRLYRYRQGELEQLTRDHSYVQQLLDEGLITELEASTSKQKNVLNKALGLSRSEVPDVAVHSLNVNDLYLSCSDGLSDMVPDTDIKAALMKHPGDLHAIQEELLALAHRAGGHDNISVILTQVNSL